jgi:hypothetical protein
LVSRSTLIANVIIDRKKINIAMMIEAARTSEKSVDNYFTRQYIPEDKSELRTRRRESENLKSHLKPVCYF